MRAFKRRRAVTPVTETELKFAVEPERVEALRAALLERRALPVDLAARYFDTQDGHLAAAGIALRLRHEGEHWLQTLKVLRDPQAFERLEHTVQRQAPAEGAVLLPDPDLHAGSLAGASLAAALGEQAPTLQERYAVLVSRLQLMHRQGRARIELAFDEGLVRGAGGETAICELEFELKSGGWPELCAAARPLDRALRSGSFH